MADEPITENENIEEVIEDDDEDLEEEQEEEASEDKRSEGARRGRPRSGGDRRPGGNRQGGGFRQGGDRSSDGGGYRQGGGGRFRARRKVCSFCVDKVKSIDWKDVDGLRRYMNNNGSIRARRKTGTCAKHQRQLAAAIKRARHLALTPYTDEHARFMSRS